MSKPAVADDDDLLTGQRIFNGPRWVLNALSPGEDKGDDADE